MSDRVEQTFPTIDAWPNRLSLVEFIQIVKLYDATLTFDKEGIKVSMPVGASSPTGKYELWGFMYGKTKGSRQ